MSAISAPPPISIGITSIADRHQPPRQPQRKPAAKAKATAVTATVPGDIPSLGAMLVAPEMADDDQGLPADTLFTVALLANSLPYRTATPDEVMLRRSHEWVPPDSDLQLTDKTI